MLVTSALLFAVFELFPGLINQAGLHRIRYYALRGNYVPDPALVVVPRWPGGGTYSFETRGDLYSPLYGVDVPVTRFSGSSTRDGFRPTLSSAPVQIVLLGDSYLEIGEDDRDTFGERLAAIASMPALNLGRAWYGPYQYLELFKRHGVGAKPRHAIFCFFAGNDVEDILEYESWRRGLGYYRYDLRGLNVLQRYILALSDTSEVLGRVGRSVVTWPRGADTVHPEIGVIDVGGSATAMRFVGWNGLHSTQELLASPAWGSLRVLLEEFRRTSVEHGITPVILYIPTKLQVYGRRATRKSGTILRDRLPQQLQYETNAEEALAQTARTVGVPVLSLLPAFQQRAAQGELLYYPFDTHWNSAGRQAAAELVAPFLATLPAVR